MSVAPMSRYTIRAYPRIYHKKLRKMELVTERVKENENLQITLTLSVQWSLYWTTIQNFNFSLRRDHKKKFL